MDSSIRALGSHLITWAALLLSCVGLFLLFASMNTQSELLRNEDFPRTYIAIIEVDLSNSIELVELHWSGPLSQFMESGPYKGSAGKGDGCDCDSVEESNRVGSNCTPKGTWLVLGVDDHLPSNQFCKFATWFHEERGIALHSHSEIPPHPASHGCVRLEEDVARLIHDNVIIARTHVRVSGTWRPSGD
jgi:hypothetical protein